MNFRDKIVSWKELPEWRQKLRDSGKKLVVTNGCFDLLHLGHVTYLETARNQGEALLVGVNGDEGVRQLKGPDRPINEETERAAVLAALESVDGVCVFPKKLRPSSWLQQNQISTSKAETIRWTLLNQEERQLVEKQGAKILIVPLLPGKSTSSLVKKISRL